MKHLIFNVKNNNELYNILIYELKYIFNKDEIIKNKDEKKSLKSNFYKVFEYLNYFISQSLIFIDDKNQINEVFEIYKILMQSNIKN